MWASIVHLSVCVGSCQLMSTVGSTQHKCFLSDARCPSWSLGQCILAPWSEQVRVEQYVKVGGSWPVICRIPSECVHHLVLQGLLQRIYQVDEVYSDGYIMMMGQTTVLNMFYKYTSTLDLDYKHWPNGSPTDSRDNHIYIVRYLGQCK